jgi:hypothetical protein
MAPTPDALGLVGIADFVRVSGHRDHPDVGEHTRGDRDGRDGRDDDAAADPVRPFLSLYIGGMGAKGANFHYEVFARMGYEAECAKIQDLYLDGRKDEAIASVPLSRAEKVAVGPKAKISDDLAAWRESLLTTMLVNDEPSTMRMMAELVGG